MIEHELPEGWEIKQLKQVAECITGNTPSKADVSNYGTYIPFIKPPQLLDSYVSDAPEYLSINGKNKARFLPKHSILISCIGNLGKTAINNVDVTFNQQINALIPFKDLYYKFIFYQAQSLQFKNQLERFSSATTVRIINKNKFERIQIVLPSIEVQKQIVAKIEQLFGELDNGINVLQTLKEQVKVFRQSILKAAFNGKLTGSYVGDDELPNGWQEAKFNDLCHKIGDIDHKMPKEISNGEYYYVSTKDFTDNYKISFEKAKLISKDDYIKLAAKIKPEKGDIIFPRYGTIGKNVLVDFDKDFLVSYSCAIIKPNSQFIDSKYLYYFSLSAIIQNEVKKYIVQTTQANIGIASIKQFKVIYPIEIKKQQEIILKIEQLLTTCDELDQTIDSALNQSQLLRQSILKQAFSGKLI